MQDILAVTEETSRGMQQTNVSIEELGRLAQTLRSSVAASGVIGRDRRTVAIDIPPRTRQWPHHMGEGGDR